MAAVYYPLRTVDGNGAYEVLCGCTGLLNRISQISAGFA